MGKRRQRQHCIRHILAKLQASSLNCWGVKCFKKTKYVIWHLAFKHDICKNFQTKVARKTSGSASDPTCSTISGSFCTHWLFSVCGCFMAPVPVAITAVTCLTIFEEIFSQLDMSPRTTFRSLRTTLQPSSRSSDSPLYLWKTSTWKGKNTRYNLIQACWLLGTLIIIWCSLLWQTAPAFPGRFHTPMTKAK